MNTEITDGILTFDELLEDDYYKAEFEKRVQERLNIENSHPDVKGGANKMDGQVQQPNEGEVKNPGEVKVETQPQVEAQPTEQPKTVENPATENKTDGEAQGKEEPKAEPKNDDPKGKEEPAREMTAEQFELYNETLRRVSKTAKASLPERYNAFEDTEVKTLVKQKVMQGETPSVKELAASVVTRLTKKEEPTAQPSTETPKAQTNPADEVLNLKAENALLKAGITTERIDAAKKLFIAEGADFAKVNEFVAKYPEWKAQEGAQVVFTKAPPLADKTVATPGGQPVLNDFEKAVAAARKKAGLPD